MPSAPAVSRKSMRQRTAVRNPFLPEDPIGPDQACAARPSSPFGGRAAETVLETNQG